MKLIFFSLDGNNIASDYHHYMRYCLIVTYYTHYNSNILLYSHDYNSHRPG